MEHICDYRNIRLQIIAVRLTLGYKLSSEQEQEWINSSQEEQLIACKAINKDRSN